jgi:membrane AbrB-like protein
MTSTSPAERRVKAGRALPFATLPLTGQWATLAAISAVITAVLVWVRLPAALMLGPMVAGILLVTGGAPLRVPAGPMNFAQAVIGLLIARSFTREILVEFGKQWPLFLGVVVTIVIASAALGYVISKLRILRGTTAVWGLLPGAAPVMILMAEAFGADEELVAFMQYMRVVFVAVTASIVARLWVHVPAGTAAGVSWFPPIAWLPFKGTLLMIGVSFLATLAPKIPAGVLIAALLIGGVLHIGGFSTLELPPWLLAIAYALLGWSVGLKFTRNVLAAAARALPQALSSILVMVVFCGVLAALLVHLLGIDPLTAYLATSPGGADSVAVIAASTKVDTSFVMALQTVRFLLILLAGPAISRFVAGLVDGRDIYRPTYKSKVND